MISLTACRRGAHDRSIAPERFDDILPDAVDQIIPVHLGCWPKMYALGHNEKPNGAESESFAFHNFYQTCELQDENSSSRKNGVTRNFAKVYQLRKNVNELIPDYIAVRLTGSKKTVN
jgi:hypothetical protein